MKQQLTIETIDELKEAIKAVWDVLTEEQYIQVIQASMGCFVVNKPSQLEDALNDIESYKKWIDLPLSDRPFFLNSSL